MLRCRGISKSFTGENGPLPVIDRVDLDLGEEEFLCVLGRSGCGKSTLLRLVAGLLEPTGGSIEFVSEGELSSRRPKCGMVFQDHGLFPWMNALGNAAFGLKMQGFRRIEREAMARTALEQVGMKPFERHYPHELSMGMRQRVALSRAFVSAPDILLMDEPFASLDAQARAILQRDLRAWQKSRKIPALFITHDIAEALALADRIVVLSKRPARILADFCLPLGRSHTPVAGFDPELGAIGREIWGILGQENGQANREAKA